MNSVGFVGLYIFMLAAFAGWVIIGRVPAILHTPLMSGSNFIHGIVVIGGLIGLLDAASVPEQAASSRPISPPITTMPWMKFEPDINGVCKMAGTRPMMTQPANAASMKI